MTLSKWRAVDGDQEPAAAHDDPRKELARLWQARDLLKKLRAGVRYRFNQWCDAYLAVGETVPRMKTALPLEALNRAIARLRPQQSLMHHADRGS